MKGEDTADIESRGKELATRCWEEDEEFLAKDKIAEWLGKQSVSHLYASIYVVWVVLTIEQELDQQDRVEALYGFL